MTHLPDDEVGAVASGDSTDDSVISHLTDCADCRHRVTGTRRAIRALARAGRETVTLEQPRPQVWEAIQSATQDPRPAAVGHRRLPAGHAASSEPSTLRPRTIVAALAGFAVGAAATVGGVLAFDRSTSEPTPPSVTTAQGRLAPLALPGTRGSATVVKTDGGRRIKIDLTDKKSTSSGFVQAWLLDPRTNQMVSLGVMDGRTGTFAIPSALDLSVFDYVDISLEPYDGNPLHSSTSLARGQLRPT